MESRPCCVGQPMNSPADALMGIFGLHRAGVAVVLPLKTVSALNGSHSHWRTVATRRKRERRTAMLMCPQTVLPCVVRLVRLSAGTLDDDNLRAALKSVRDGIADRLGVADNSPLVRWDYGQERCKRGEYAVRVEITNETGETQ